MAGEVRALLDVGVDGVITDHPEIARAPRLASSTILTFTSALAARPPAAGWLGDMTSRSLLVAAVAGRAHPDPTAPANAHPARRTRRDRPPRRLRLPPRAHARGVPARHPRRAPTTSSPTWSRPRTASSSPGTRTRSAAPPTSPTTRSSRRGGPPRSSTAPRSPAGSPRTSPTPSSRTLRAVERLPRVRPDNTAYDGQFQVPTLDEVLDLARYDEGVGVYPETKHPTLLRLDRAVARGAARGRARGARPRRRRRRRSSSSPSRSATCATSTG